MKDNKWSLFLSMALGMIGTIVIIVGLSMLIDTNNSFQNGHFIALIGLSLVVGYIDFLEGKAGIDMKYRWIKFIIVAFSLLLLYLIF